jgi:hypothetical protein
MGQWLEKDEFVPFASPIAGEEVHVHHCKDGRGNDRLYVRRNEDGSIVGFCHHCHSSGYCPPMADYETGEVSEGDYQRGEHERGDTVRSTNNALFSLPNDVTGEWGRFGVECQQYLRRYFEEDAIERSPLCWSERGGSLIIPIYCEDGLLLYQERAFPARADAPKYQTWRNPEFTGQVSNVPLEKGNSTLVYTEDWLSAWKWTQVDGVSGMPMLGTHLSRTQAVQSIDFDRVYVHLDNDNPDVRRAQVRHVFALSKYRPVASIWTDKDPKEYSPAELEALL